MLGNLGRYITKRLPENNQYERIWILAKTDFKLKYYDTFLGMIWAIASPLFRILIYYFVFTFIFTNKIPNYGLHIFSGLLVWMFFQEATKKGLTILKSKRYLIENIKFNKLDLFVSSLLSSLMALIVNLIVYFIVTMFFKIPITWNLLFIPLIILNICILVFAVNLILSTINIFFRDMSQIWDMILLAMFWINPIFYAKSVIFEYFPILMYINPLAGIIVNIREGLMYGNPPDWNLLLYDYAYALVLLSLGLLIFYRYFHKAAEKL